MREASGPAGGALLDVAMPRAWTNHALAQLEQLLHSWTFTPVATVFILLLPSAPGTTPDLAAALAQFLSATTILPLQVLWVALFLYYGRSRVTGSTLSFHVIPERL